MKKRLSLFFLLLVIILGVIAGCKQEEMDDTYVNERHGYTFEIPAIWKEKKDKVEIIEEEGSGVTFAYLFECHELDHGGEECYQNFFTISVMSEEEYEKELSNPPVVSNFIVENEGQVYVIYTPLDNIILDKETIEEYSEMHLSLEEIIERFSLMASNEETIDGEIKTDIKNPTKLTEDKENEMIEVVDYYFEPIVSAIEGRLITRMYYGPPNYGENPDTDAQQYPFILELDEPIDVIALEDDIHNSDKFEVTEIQVVPKNKEETELVKQYINKRIRIQGTLFEAIFGGHHTDVLIYVDEILDTTYNDLITNLEIMGFNVVAEDVGEDILQGERKRLTINDNENISVYQYESNEKMEEDASYIHEGGTSYNNGKDSAEISWSSYPHFFKKDNIIVLYVGEDLEIINGLKEIVGVQFAGYTE